MLRLFNRSMFLASCLSLLVALSTMTKAETLSDAKEAGVLKIGMESLGSKPYIWQNEDGSYAGFEHDMLLYALGKLGIKKFEYVVSEWPTMIPGLKSKRWISSGAVSITEERRISGGIQFTDPYFMEITKVAVLKGSDIKTMEDLKGKTLGTMLGTTQESNARTLMSKGLGKDVKLFDTLDQPFIALQNKQIDAVVMDYPTIAGKEAQLPDIMILEGPPMYPDPPAEWAERQAKANYQLGGLGIGVRDEDKEMLASLNAMLKEMNADGTRQKILEKYNLWTDEQKPENMMK